MSDTTTLSCKRRPKRKSYTSETRTMLADLGAFATLRKMHCLWNSRGTHRSAPLDLPLIRLPRLESAASPLLSFSSPALRVLSGSPCQFASRLMPSHEADCTVLRQSKRDRSN